MKIISYLIDKKFKELIDGNTKKDSIKLRNENVNNEDKIKEDNEKIEKNNNRKIGYLREFEIEIKKLYGKTKKLLFRSKKRNNEEEVIGVFGNFMNRMEKRSERSYIRSENNEKAKVVAENFGNFINRMEDDINNK
jgi:hypothetical protein